MKLTRVKALFILFGFAAGAVGQTQTQNQGQNQGQATSDPANLATIEGRTVSSDGQPLRKSTITLRPLQVFNGGGGAGGQLVPQMPTPYGTTSDAEGKFSFTGLVPGRYTLSADHPGYVNATYGMKRTAAGAMTGNSLITLTAGQHMTSATIEMVPQATISGKVTDEDGDPLPRINIRGMRRVYNGGASRMQPAGNVTADDEGNYKLTGLEAGRYYVMFMPPRNPGRGGATRRAGATAGEQEVDYAATWYPGVADLTGAMALDVAAGQDRQGMNLQMHKVPVFHARGKIGGDLPFGDGDFGARLQLIVTPVGGDAQMGIMNGMQAMNPDGTFDVGGLTPGTWTISVIRTQGQLQTLSVATVQVSNHDVTDLVVGVRPPFDILGSVRIVPESAATATPTTSPGGQASNGRASNGQASNVQASSGQASSNGQNGGGQGASPPPRVNRVLLTPMDAVIGGTINAMVQPDGSFTLKNLGPLRYKVMVQTNQQGYLKSATVDGRDVLESGMDLRNGSGTLAIVYSMSAAEIDGTVTTSDGPPAPDATVTIVPDPVQPERTNLYRQTRSDASGAFTLKGLPPGKYKVYAWVDVEPGAYMDPDFIKPFESLGASVKVDENDHGQVSVQQITTAQAADINRRNGR